MGQPHRQPAARTAEAQPGVGGSAGFASDVAEGKEALVVVAEVNGGPDLDQVVHAIGTAVLRDRERPVIGRAARPAPGILKRSRGEKQRSATRSVGRAAGQRP